MTVAKNQHFLPKFYLRKFVDPNTLPNQEPSVWIFKLSERRWQRRAPKNIASLRYYYAHQDENGQRINIIDPTFAALESLNATLTRKLEAQEKLTLPEQIDFSYFIALLTVRTPESRATMERYLKSIGQGFIAEMIHRWREKPEEFLAAQRRYQEKTGMPADIGIDYLEKHPPQLFPNDAGIISYSLIPARALAERLMGMTWRFYFTKAEERLIICDHPCDFAYPDNVTEESFCGFFTKDVEFHVPLTPNLLFTAYDDGFDPAFGGLLNDEDVAMLNRRMARRAEQFIVSAKPTFLGDEVLQLNDGGLSA